MTSPVHGSPFPGDEGRKPSDSRNVRLRPRRRSRAPRAILGAVAVGGVAGTLVRYWLTLLVPTTSGSFPWTTFTINISGSALLGFLLIVLLEQFPNGRLGRPLIGTGFIGAFTTFSTYCVDAVLLVRAHHALTAALYVASSVIGGVLAAWCGMTAARLSVRIEHHFQREAS